MKIIVPKTSGFCYGVSLAVKEAENIIASHRGLIMYGEIVHNPDVVKGLESKGGKTVESPSEIKKEDISSDAVILIRAHGVSKKIKNELERTGLEVRDKTCPKVKNVHRIVSEEEAQGRNIVIVGNPSHPEVIGIIGQCEGTAVVVATPEQAQALELSGAVSVVVQTTFNGILFKEIEKVLLEKYEGVRIFNTMCPATNIRQQEISRLSENVDAVIVLGGKKSSNSLKLCEIAGRNAESVLVEKVGEIDLELLKGKESVVVCGGSSTPYELIRDAAEYIKEHFEAEIEYL